MKKKNSLNVLLATAALIILQCQVSAQRMPERLMTAIQMAIQQSPDPSAIPSPDSVAGQRSSPAGPVDDLFLLGKVWGFLKYYHPGLASGKVDWDSELLHFIPIYRRLGDPKAKNDSLLAWIDRLGDIPACDSCTTSPPQTAKLTPDFSWMNNDQFSPKLRSKLHFIIRNRNTRPNYYVNSFTADGVTLPLFQHEKSYTGISYPDSNYGILSLFRFWNVIEYWYPYKYNLRTSWDNVLRQFIPRMMRENDLHQYVGDVEELVGTIDDTHGWITWSRDAEIHGRYTLPFTLRFFAADNTDTHTPGTTPDPLRTTPDPLRATPDPFKGKWVVTSFLDDSLAGAAGIRIGDIIDSIDGRATIDIARSLAPYCPASNTASLLHKLGLKMIRTQTPQSRLSIEQLHRRRAITTNNYKPALAALVDGNPPFSPYLKDSSYCLLEGRIGYLNLGRIDRKDSAGFLTMIQGTQGLIIDTRQNADEIHGTNAADIIGRIIMPSHTPFVRFSSAQPSFPGVFTLTEPGNMGLPASEKPYAGKVAILIDENTTSVGEFIAMAYKIAPHARLIGTHTAGADGNVSYIGLPGGVMIQFTALGVYYPDGGETQRVGIQPDLMVPQSLEGFRRREDMPMKKAMEWIRDGKK